MFTQKCPLILASGSPRRKEILDTMGLEFSVDVSDADESFAGTPKEMVLELSRRKAQAVASRHSGAIILAADTLVYGDEVLGKPHDRQDACRMLRELSGQAHEVVTAVVIRDSSREIAFTDSTTVHFAPLEESEIDYYVDNFKPYDKAGAYGIQEWIGYAAITGIEGSYFNVMGLPVHRLYEELKSFFK